MNKLNVGLTSLKPGLILCVAALLILNTACTSTTTRTSGSATSGPTIIDGSQRLDDNKRFDSRLQLAYAYFQGGELEVAMEEVDKALEIRSNSAEAISLKGMIYSQLGDTANAQQYLKRALALAPGNAEYLHNYGAALCVNKQNSEGIAYLQQAINAQGYTDKVHSLGVLGVCYMQAGDVIQAENAFRQTLSIDAGNSLALYQLADLMYQRNDLQGAQQYFDQLMTSDSLNARSLWLGIKIARQQGDAYRMGQYARDLRARYPNSPERSALERGDFYQ